MSPTNTPSVTSLRLDRFLAALKYVLPAAPKGEDNALMARVCFRGDRIWAGDDYRLLMARVEGAHFRPVAWDGGAARRLCALLTAMRSDLQPELLINGQLVDATFSAEDNTLTPNVALNDGVYQVSYRYLDLAGNASAGGSVTTVTIDTRAPVNTSLTLFTPTAIGGNYEPGTALSLKVNGVSIANPNATR